ncbi:MAG TPA: hypothetical protein VKR59_07790 [Terriglobales bacterium]|nr:hypothetical protein [Terriglobales bacterium]
MQKRSLTRDDVPFLRDEIMLWHQAFGFKPERAWIVSWAQYFPHDYIRKAIAITKKWASKTPNITRPEAELYRFTNGTLSHMADAAKVADELLGVEL